MTENISSYRQIFKATSLFGGVQVFNILIAIIRSKFIAILLGPAGMGIAGLLTSTIGFIGSLTNMGLGTSAVKNVSVAAASGDRTRVITVVSVLRRLVWLTGLVGMVLTIIISPYLSQITFGNKNYTVAFIWISITLLFQQLSSGQMVVLQGLRKLEYLAKANLFGSIIGLAVSLPIYYVWRIDGIVPVIIIASLASMILSWYFANKVEKGHIKPNRKTMVIEGREMIKMGFLLSLTGLIAAGVSYIIRIYINNTGGVEEVGLYSAGFTLITTYVGMVFTAMATDYFPRLSSVAADNLKSNQLINQQAEIAILILAPILVLLIVFINWIVIALYSSKFVAITDMIIWSALGMYFKAASWSVAFVLLAKGASRLYLWNEMLGNIYILGFSLIGYKLAGLEGLGISFLISYFIYLFQVFLITRIKYGFEFQKSFYQLAGLQFILCIICIAVIKFLQTPWIYIISCPVILCSIAFSIQQLDRRIDLKRFVIGKFNNLTTKS